MPQYVPMFIAAALLLVAGCAEGHNRPNATASETVAAPVGLIDLDGNACDLWHHDGVNVVVFTRSDCPISNRYAPEIRRLYKVFHPRGAEFHLVYVDPNESPDAIRAHLKDYDYPCQALRDTAHVLVKQTGVTITPEAVVFGNDRTQKYRGRIDNRYADLGNARPAATTQDLADAIEATLEGRPINEPITEAIGCYIEDFDDASTSR